MKVKDIQRFQKLIELDLLTGCWLWKNFLNHGYGEFYINGKQDYAHRVSYQHWNGGIPKGLEIDHLCKNKNCVNPEHLETVTHAENIQRSKSLYCIKGHFKSGTNLITTKNNFIVCRICKNNWNVEYRRRLKIE